MSRQIGTSIEGVPDPSTATVELIPDAFPILLGVQEPGTGHFLFDVPDTYLHGFHRRASAPGFETQTERVRDAQGHDIPIQSAPSELIPPLVLAPIAVPEPVPLGQVTLVGHCLAVDEEPWLALGHTYFPTFWMEKHEPDRLEQNLVWLRDRGVDYVRALGMNGGPSWADRRIDPHAADYWIVAQAALDRLVRLGLWLKLSIFSEATLNFPTQAGRIAFVRQWAAVINQQPERFLFVEVANEHQGTGLPSNADVRELGAILAQETDVLVALSATKSDNVCALYKDSAADIATLHYDRNRPGNKWNATRQPWGYPGEYAAQGNCSSGHLPEASNNEPIGIDSSVKEDEDPLRLVLGAVTTFIAQNNDHTVHSGAGIRAGGQADLDRGRKANVWEQPTLQETLLGIQVCRELLPRDLPNWTRRNAQTSGHPFIGFDTAVETGKLVRSYASLRGRASYIGMLGIMKAFTGKARWAMTVEQIDVLTGAILRTLTLAKDAPITFTPREHRKVEGDGCILRCSW